MAVPEQHRFKVSMFDFACEALEVNEDKCEPYLRIDFDNYKVFKTDCEANTRFPEWGFKAGFQYKARFLEQLVWRKLKVQCFDRAQGAHAHQPIGEAEVDLQTIACGPAYFRLTLRNLEGSTMGFVTFICMMKMISRNVAVTFQGLKVSMQGSPAPSRLQISTTLSDNVMVEAPFTQDGEWNVPFVIGFEAALGDMLKKPEKEYLKIQVLDMHSVPQGQAMLAFGDNFQYPAVAPLEFKVPVGYSGEVETRLGLVSTDDSNVAVSGAVGEITGYVSYQGLPVYAQMAGGLCFDGKIDGGHLLFENLPYPKGVSEPPPVWEGQNEDEEIDLPAVPQLQSEEKIILSSEELSKALELIEAPPNWEIRKDRKTGRHYFADVRYRRTTWTDPRFLPDHWDQRIDATTGQLYFAYHKTRKTTFVDPRYCPKDWDMRLSKNGEIYFANHKSMSTTYNDPRGLPRNWDCCLDDKGRTYFKNHTVKSTTWTDPREGQVEEVLRDWKHSEMYDWIMEKCAEALADLERERQLEAKDNDQLPDPAAAATPQTGGYPAAR
eukprot:gnl/MRDRNA2_/MRDRNA2_32883_c0_seq1.p1 gnl/MRDRNA2_/MRDRNA2_32883_c0~~gnl/MRDRNA2_/MRDRNA2_32883_c0_seq1.p1  ORF type:complete len:589 (+),score=120.31 gnl/MRDRNA2_/MRDRNA2_32883_c0_seq1:121-1767(+)